MSGIILSLPQFLIKRFKYFALQYPPDPVEAFEQVERESRLPPRRLVLSSGGRRREVSVVAAPLEILSFVEYPLRALPLTDPPAPECISLLAWLYADDDEEEVPDNIHLI